MKMYVDAWCIMPPAQRWMVILLAVAVLLANYRQPYPDVAPLQHIPTALLIGGAPYLLRHYPLSNRSVAMLLLFFLLHTLGGRYAYSNVPYDAWARTVTGYEISCAFGLARNAFDRVVHLSFGLLWVPPLAEIARRHGGTSGRASLWIAVLFVGWASALYEIFEWLLTVVIAPDMADVYNGQQGDPWDSQKDMALALVGAALSAIALARRSVPAA